MCRDFLAVRGDVVGEAGGDRITCSGGAAARGSLGGAGGDRITFSGGVAARRSLGGTGAGVRSVEADVVEFADIVGAADVAGIGPEKLVVVNAS